MNHKALQLLIATAITISTSQYVYTVQEPTHAITPTKSISTSDSDIDTFTIGERAQSKSPVKERVAEIQPRQAQPIQNRSALKRYFAGCCAIL